MVGGGHISHNSYCFYAGFMFHHNIEGVQNFDFYFFALVHVMP